MSSSPGINPSRPSTTITIKSAHFSARCAVGLDELVERILAGAEQSARVGQIEVIAAPMSTGWVMTSRVVPAMEFTIDRVCRSND